ncbi:MULTISPECIES: hypothetical protein [unclassified Mycobacterium]|uniref:hypothetical protein n=1 Tax=unclassified Mycobacterium TaxID=2642494 RepID=UPI00073FB8AA|nr:MULTISPECIES: hypothetical protein [unclassified Mycobacterium]KUH87555.1 hypothetical protein AU186_02905 [Mycobacterium sp. GA-1999]KUH90270.1 hypothetical protein AU187_22295 [Mycobacterium sp. IS-1556]KUH90830.1 hypothetical protein AU185_03810 [Mycobacterium sp. GA-0227b]
MSVFDRVVAPGATRDEIALSVAGAAAGAILAAALAWHAGWSPLAVVVVMVVAADGFGGVVVNATASNTRWFHRPKRTRALRISYVAAHVHPFVLALFVPGFSWTAAFVIYAVVLTAALAITVSPPTQRPPVAFLCAALCLATASVLTIPTAVSWFAPVLIVQLLLSHQLSFAAPSRSTT